MSASSWPELFGSAECGEGEGRLSSDVRAAATDRQRQQLAAIHQRERRRGSSRRLIERMV